METILLCKMYNQSLQFWGFTTKILNIFNKAAIAQMFMLAPVKWIILVYFDTCKPYYSYQLLTQKKFLTEKLSGSSKVTIRFDQNWCCHQRLKLSTHLFKMSTHLLKVYKFFQDALSNLVF